MANKIEAGKQENVIFFLVAFAVPYLMGIPLAICQRAGYDTSCFANAQMFYPAAGVMLAYMAARRSHLPVRFYLLHIMATLLCLLCSLLSVVMPTQQWILYLNAILIAASVLGWILLLSDQKEKRERYSLCWRGKFLAALGICVPFLALKTVMMFLSVWVQGAQAWMEYLTYWQTYVPWVNALLLIPNFFFCFLPFFGEEYGWRYFLTPILQKRFGCRLGVLLLGVLWGLWHLPLNLFFYSPQTSLQSLLSQIVVCVTMGVFFTFAYEMCDHNIWVPVVLHYLNNNMIIVWAGTSDISNQVYTWADVGGTAILYSVLFLPFLATKVFKCSQ